MLDDKWARAFVARVAGLSRGDIEGSKPVDTYLVLDLLIRDARVALGQPMGQPVCAVTGKRNCADRDCELHYSLAPLGMIGVTDTASGTVSGSALDVAAGTSASVAR